MATRIAKTIAKCIAEEATTIAGRLARGKLIFLMRFACSTKTDTERWKTSVKVAQVNRPAERKIP